MNANENGLSVELPSRRRRRLTVFLVTAFAIFDSAALIISFTGTEISAPTLTGLFAPFFTCQASLVAIWVVFGKGRFHLRLLATIPGAFLFSWTEAYGNSDAVWPLRGMTFLLLYLMGAFVPFALARVFDWHWHLLPTGFASRQIQFSRRPIQFTIAGLVVLTFITACAAAVFHSLDPTMDELIVAVESVFFIVGFGFVLVWVSMARGWHYVRLTLALPALVVGAYYLDALANSLTGSTTDDMSELVQIVVMHLALVAGVLLLYRRVGYRAVRGRPVEIPTELDAAQLFAPQ